MYSFAPAWIAATAARASVEVPQATTGTVMCSASSRVIRSRISIATSTISRSALRPERKTRNAISASSAWVTVAPLSMASLVASVSWPRSVPTISRRMGEVLLSSLAPRSGERVPNERSEVRRVRGVLSACKQAAPHPARGVAARRPLPASGEREKEARSVRNASASFRLDHFRHGHAELLLDQHDFAARDQPIIDVDVNRLADLAVELEHCAGAEPQEIADIHAGAAEHGRDLHRHVEHGFEIGGAARRLPGIGRKRGLILRRDLGVAVELGQGNLGVVTHRSLLITRCRAVPPH